MFVSGAVTAIFQYFEGDSWNNLEILTTGDIPPKYLLGFAVWYGI